MSECNGMGFWYCNCNDCTKDMNKACIKAEKELTKGD